MAIQPLATTSEEDRTVGPFADSQVDRSGYPGCEGDGEDLAALADDGEGAMPALEAEILDVGADGFGDSQPVEGQQAD